MLLDSTLSVTGRPAFRRFWRAARGFWRSAKAWTLLAILVLGVVLQVVVQYRINFWNRDFFNALEARDGSQIWFQAQLLVGLAAASVGLAVTVTVVSSSSGGSEPAVFGAVGEHCGMRWNAKNGVLPIPTKGVKQPKQRSQHRLHPDVSDGIHRRIVAETMP